jgi:hypothetical protein
MSDEVLNRLERLKRLGQTQGFLAHAQLNEQTLPAIIDPEKIADIVGVGACGNSSSRGATGLSLRPLP